MGKTTLSQDLFTVILRVVLLSQKSYRSHPHPSENCGRRNRGLGSCPALSAPLDDLELARTAPSFPRLGCPASAALLLGSVRQESRRLYGAARWMRTFLNLSLLLPPFVTLPRSGHGPVWGRSSSAGHVGRGRGGRTGVAVDRIELATSDRVS